MGRWKECDIVYQDTLTESAAQIPTGSLTREGTETELKRRKMGHQDLFRAQGTGYGRSNPAKKSHPQLMQSDIPHSRSQSDLDAFTSLTQRDGRRLAQAADESLHTTRKHIENALIHMSSKNVAHIRQPRSFSRSLSVWLHLSHRETRRAQESQILNTSQRVSAMQYSHTQTATHTHRGAAASAQRMHVTWITHANMRAHVYRRP